MKDRRVRAAIFSVAAVVLALVITQFVLPGGGGTKDGLGTPVAEIFQGFVFGLLNALLAVGIVIIYRSQRIINFAQAAFGAAGGVFTFNMAVLLNWPYLLAFVAGVVVSAMLGIAFELAFVRRFFNAPRLVLTVVTIALIPAFQFAAGFVSTLPIFPPTEDRTVEELAGRTIALPFNKFHFELGSLGLRFHFGHLFAIGIAIVALGAVAWFFRYSKTGVAVRAASENSERARLLGISVGNLSLIVWTIAAILGGLAVILTSTVQRSFSQTAAPVSLLLIALSAAVFARMESLPIAAGAAILISVVREAVRFSYQEQVAVLNVALWVLLLVSLVLAGTRGKAGKSKRSEESEATAWKATEEVRPTPKEMLEVAGIRVARRVLIGLGLLTVIMFPFIVPSRQTNLAGFYAIVTIALLSLTVLTGWAGQPSLGQFAFVAVGAVVGGALTSRVGLPFFPVLVFAPLVTAAMALLVGIPALRIRGLFLAVATYAMAFAVQSALFEEKYFGWLLPGRIERPTFFLLDFEDERSMYFLSVGSLVAAILLVLGLRRTRPGRVLIGLRDNENNSRSFGIDPTRMKLTAFAVSGYLAGFAGVLIAHHQRAAQMQSFTAQDSLDAFLFAVVGGVGSVLGVVLGGLYYASRDLITNNSAQFIIGPLGILVLLYVAPGGLASLVQSIRDGVLRIVAQRRQMVVPALFADFDPEALERQLIPLAEPLPNSGLAALPVDRRYRGTSELYGARGRLVAAITRRSREALALGAAAEGSREAEEALEAST